MPNQPSHIAVIGAGIIGCSIAYHLSKQGAQVTLIDQADPGQGTTSVSFAWINGRDKNPRHYHDLNRRALDHWPRFARQLQAEPALTWGGELRWAATDDDAEEIVQRVRTLQSWGYPISLLDEDELTQLEPKLKPGLVTAASFTEIDGHIDTQSIIRACVQYLQNAGATLHKAQITGFVKHDNKIQAVQTTDGEIPCDTVVLAAGSDTAQIAEMAQFSVPLYDTFGCTIITEPVPPIFQNISVVHTPRDVPPQTNFRQLPDGSVMMHGGAHGRVFDGGSLGQNDDEIKIVREAVARYLPALEGVPIRDVRRGRRPIPKDGHPILGFNKHVTNLYLTVMHSGVTLAPLVGECTALEILEKTQIDYLEPYRLSRFD